MTSLESCGLLTAVPEDPEPGYQAFGHGWKCRPAVHARFFAMIALQQVPCRGPAG